jgi:asparagine synthase (glutamine-hydrolysing)
MAKNYTDNIDAYSIGFEDKSYDDSSIILNTSNFLNLSLNHNVLDEFNVNDSVEFICNNIDEPFSDTSIVPSYFLSKLQSKDKIVIIGGDGSDEIFYGYSTFNALIYSSILNKLPNNIFNLIKNMSSYFNPTNQYMSIGYKLSKLLMIKNYPESVWNPMWLSLLNPNEINNLFGSNVKFDDLYSEAIGEWENSSSTIYGKTSEFYVKFFLPNMILAKIDRAWMWNGLEYRSPFLDYNLVDYVSTINERYKVGLYKNKKILKEIFSDRLPNYVLKHKKKGFNFPITRWLKNTNNISDIMNIDTLLDKKINLHLNSKEDNRNLLWSLKLLKRQQII